MRNGFTAILLPLNTRFACEPVKPHFSIKKELRLKRRGFLLVVTSTGLPAVFH